MILFWVAASLLASASAGLIIYRASRAAARAAGPGEDPTLVVYRRQLAEVEDLAGLGLISPEESRSTRTEAARRLLSAADAAEKPADGGANGRLAVLIIAIVAPLIALGIYIVVGSPGTPDQPFGRRLAVWRKQDPGQLDAQRMVAVLQAITDEKPGDPTPLTYLAEAEAASGDTFSAERNLQKALKLAPKKAELWMLYGQMVASDQPGDVLPDEARKAFQTAVTLAPQAMEPRYFLARDQIATGHVDQGLAGWKALRADLTSSDPRAQGLEQEILLVERDHALPPGERTTGPGGQGGEAAQQAGDQKAFIRAMVSRLAARLEANPNDPAGWARLVRSYSVLGDNSARDAALARARSLFKDRPGDLSPIEAAAR
ncbi:c-type cytochrome biogenesis protein CcmI [Phenylobacterium montanum]|uniref:C-type cytochrome biogenesis protein CcmI n=1 Tax=Phenylobacterium montanum TaxID=2823693 RepID=A0A975FWI3_9CAUL|nr:c-type cytochrome biogenesis protein CcmI [Caulobacter sp. S6]QUD86108.1 c-type cytochrome biogenesis protein CcmI [Caulobacter sp. S6]